MVKLCKQIDVIQIHAKKKYMKVLIPAADYSPQVQHWYDRIYGYVALLELKKGTYKYQNAANTNRMDRRNKIKKPSELTIEEIKDKLSVCKIRAEELRKQDKDLRKTHLGNCWVKTQEKK